MSTCWLVSILDLKNNLTSEHSSYNTNHDVLRSKFNIHLTIAVKKPIHMDFDLIKKVVVQGWIQFTADHLFHRVSYLCP